jgi:hypothetical protein
VTVSYWKYAGESTNGQHGRVDGLSITLARVITVTESEIVSYAL